MVGFKRRFGPYVKDGSKTHTVRTWAARVGQRLDCYTDPRRKTMALAGRFICVRVEPIAIGADYSVVIAEHPLSWDERQEFAWRDGFREEGRARAFTLMINYYIADDALPFNGWVNHWDYSTRSMRKLCRRRKAEPHA